MSGTTSPLNQTSTQQPQTPSNTQWQFRRENRERVRAALNADNDNTPTAQVKSTITLAQEYLKQLPSVAPLPSRDGERTIIPLKEAIRRANTYEDLLKITTPYPPSTEKVIITISRWGGRWITIEGYEGEASIDDLAGRMIQLNPIDPENPPAYSQIDSIGEVVKMQITELYLGMYKKRQEWSFITKIFIFIRRNLIPMILSRIDGRRDEDGFYIVIPEQEYQWRLHYGDIMGERGESAKLHFYKRLGNN